MVLGRSRSRQLIISNFWGQSFSGTDTAVVFGQDGQVTGTTSTSNPGFPGAVRLRRCWLNTGTFGVTVSGDWTMRLRLNRSGTDAATFTFNPTTADDVFSGGWAPEVLIQKTDQYHLLADGPERVFMIIRAVLEFEMI